MSKRVFISYEHDGEKDFVNGIRGMIANDNIDIDFYDESVKNAIDSDKADYVKRKLKDKIKRASTTLVIVGKDTHSSKWVKWEVNKSRELSKHIIFMRRKDDTSSSMPKEVLENDYIDDWNIEKLKKL